MEIMIKINTQYQQIHLICMILHRRTPYSVSFHGGGAPPDVCLRPTSHEVHFMFNFTRREGDVGLSPFFWSHGGNTLGSPN